MQSHRITTLPSGLRIATERIPGVHSVSVGAWIGVGARDEAPVIAGASHLIEHMLFRGSERYDALEVAQIFDRFGADLNAATEREATMVYARIIDRHLPKALDVMLDMVVRPTWAELEPEREVVLEEIAMYDDTPDDLVHDMIGEIVFPGLGIGRPVIGFRDTIERVSLDELRAHHGSFYRPGNVVVSAAGSVDHDAFCELVAAGTEGWEDQARPVRRAVSPVHEPRRAFEERDTEQFHLCLGAPGMSRHDDRRFALALLDQILGGGASSRLFQEIRERRGMAYAVYSYYFQFSETGGVYVYLGTRGENVEESLAVTAEAIGELTEGRIPADELDRARDAMKGRLALSMESTVARMTRIGKGLLHDSELLDEDEIAERLDAVAVDDVAALAAELFDPALLSVACIGPDQAVYERALGALTGSTPGAAA